MLKRLIAQSFKIRFCQPPSGGCVLKPEISTVLQEINTQPPSGGCVLKLNCQVYIMPVNPASRLQAAVC
mgnify:CR=1 FL=1